ncbi:MAG: PqiA/YebS family transporter subunit [Betaproteobacteria bacterium]|nr:PqiA/YebS family transporter subunit [Betaproteobacteria bacterium]
MTESPVATEKWAASVPGYAPDGLMACHACDGVHRIVPVPERAKALCRRCGSLLYRNMPRSLDHSTALYLAVFILFLLANTFPFVALQYGDRVEQSLLISGGWALQRAGMEELGLLVLLTSVVFPFLTMCGMLYLLLPLRFGVRPPWMTPVWKMVRALTPWSLIGVFMLGLLVSVVKLQDLAAIIPGVAFYAFIGLLVVSAAAVASFDPAVLWPRMGPVVESDALSASADSAAAMGYAACHACDLLVRRPAGGARWVCPRCGSAVHGMRIADSLSRTWGLLTAAVLLLVPANLFPVMTVTRFGQGEPSTILSGVVHLVEDGAWPLGLLVFFASFIVPIRKIAALVYLLVTVQRGSPRRLRDRTLLYRVTEAVGAWSMIDIFLVGILVALVRMDGLAVVYPGIGATFFGAAVVLTMMAAHAFDPRLVWDRAGSRA